MQICSCKFVFVARCRCMFLLTCLDCLHLPRGAPHSTIWKRDQCGFSFSYETERLFPCVFLRTQRDAELLYCTAGLSHECRRRSFLLRWVFYSIIHATSNTCGVTLVRRSDQKHTRHVHSCTKKHTQVFRQAMNGALVIFTSKRRSRFWENKKKRF